ncbi:DUF1616 domain-containing protein [Halorubrum sp. CBA1125]|uniref:DUF1616 domain-containing protein n=1 Tax=Halorubrum sp. CBA1125 TaxID=2668072 RepID=UPI0012E7FF7A|nr:DUF1616 domain-containing protein [Halorubrum sp. CBA1125]MUW14938.1 DUF1616 domain-containing protein [Halorubrum sp. CBA1125]
MADRQDAWLLLPRPVRRLPADLAATVVLTLSTLATVFVPIVSETPLRVGFGLVFVLFLPGYAFIAALFPEAGTADDEDAHAADAAGAEAETSSTGTANAADDGKPSPVPGTEAAEHAADSDATAGADAVVDGADRSGIDGIERVALSFGLSIAIVPLIGLVLNFTPWGIRLVPVATAVAGFTLVCVAVAAQRRWALPEAERFAVPYRDWIAAGKRELFEPDDRVDAALTVLLVVSVVLAVGSVGYAVAVPPQGEQFTEFYLLTENPEGELVADGYPETMDRNETAELIVGIGNHEYESTTYTVVVQLQDVETANNTTRVLDRTEIDRFDATVAHNETHHERHTLRPTRTGEDLRVQYLLYEGTPPEAPTSENAYRELHLWIDVE